MPCAGKQRFFELSTITMVLKSQEHLVMGTYSLSVYATGQEKGNPVYEGLIRLLTFF